jgi:hypothetical protein
MFLVHHGRSLLAILPIIIMTSIFTNTVSQTLETNLYYLPPYIFFPSRYDTSESISIPLLFRYLFMRPRRTLCLLVLVALIKFLFFYLQFYNI